MTTKKQGNDTNKNKDHIKRMIDTVRKDLASQPKIYTLDELQKIVPDGYLDD